MGDGEDDDPYTLEDLMKAVDLAATAAIMIIGAAAILWRDSMLLGVGVALALAVPWVLGIKPALERRRESR